MLVAQSFVCFVPDFIRQMRYIVICYYRFTVAKNLKKCATDVRKVFGKVGKYNYLRCEHWLRNCNLSLQHKRRTNIKTYILW
jgi:hypothetical protein